MTLDPQTRADVIERTAQILAKQIADECGNLDEIILIDVSAAAQALGCSRPHVRKILRPVRVSPRIEGVSLADIRRYQAERKARPVKISTRK